MSKNRRFKCVLFLTKNLWEDGFTGPITLILDNCAHNSEHGQFKCQARLLRRLLSRALFYSFGREIFIALSGPSLALGQILFLYSHGFNVTPGEPSPLSRDMHAVCKPMYYFNIPYYAILCQKRVNL